MYCNNYFIIIMATLYVNNNNNMVRYKLLMGKVHTDDSSKLKTICVWAIQFIKLILVMGLGCIVKGNWTTI